MKEEVQNNEAKIAVIGMACWYPGSRNYTELWENILSRRQQFRKTPRGRLPLAEYHDPDPEVPDKTYGTQMAVIDGFEYDWIANRIPKSTYESTDLVHWLAVDIAMKALADAGYAPETLAKEKAGVILGNTLTGEFSRSNGLRLRWPYVAKVFRKVSNACSLPPDLAERLIVHMEECYKSPFPAVGEDSLAGGLANTIAGRICNYLDLKGGGYVVDGACSSSLLAIARAADNLVQKDLDLVFAGGVDLSLDTMEMIGFAKTRALTSGAMKVYDREGSGFIPGEGCGFVVLKRLDEALRDGDLVYAVLTGWGISSDGRGGMTAPSPAGQSLALKRAYAKAGYHPLDVDFIEGHGTGTAVGDRAEIEGILLADATFEGTEAMAGDPGREVAGKGLTSLKSVIGHTKAASGVGGFIKAVIAVNRRILPPTAGLVTPNAAFFQDARHLYPIRFGKICDPGKIMRAGVTGAGFGGINAHLTLESRGKPCAKLAPSCAEELLLNSAQDSELFLLSGETAEDVAGNCARLAAVADGISLAEMTDLSAMLADRVDPGLPWRGAVVASGPQELVERLNRLAEMSAETPPQKGEVRRTALNDVWLGYPRRQPRIGFLCAGQGAQQLNMARDLSRRHRFAREQLALFDDVLGERNGQPFSAYVYRDTDRAGQEEQRRWTEELKRTEIAQPAIALATVLWSMRLARLGCRPELVAGHSMGEVTAFYLAGAFSASDLYSFLSLRGRAMAGSVERPGAMVSLVCNGERARELARGTAGYWTVANINSPRQTVLAGEQEAIAAISRTAAASGVQAIVLPVSNAFHCQFMTGAAARLKGEGELPETFEPGAPALFSGMTGGKIRGRLNLRSHFAEQVLAPVEYVSMIGEMARECDLLIEVGPGRIQANLVRDITGGALLCLPVASQPGSARDFNSVLAACFAHGGELQFPALFEDRFVRQFVPPAKRNFLVNSCEKELSMPSLPAGKHPPKSAGDGFGPVAEQLAEFGLPRAEVASYLARRGRFLSAVIRADINALDHKGGAGDDRGDCAGSGGRGGLPARCEEAVGAIPTPVEPGGGQEQEPTEAEQPAAEPVAPQALIEERIFARIVEKTGFPRESLSSEMHLLNDLNMESIKAGELIVAIAREFGVEGRLDPASLAQVKIRELAAAVERARGIGGGGEGPAEMLEQLARSSGSKSWVRNFRLEAAVEPLPEYGEDERTVAAGPVLLLHEPEQQAEADALVSCLRARGMQAGSSLYREECEQLSEASVLLGLLPRRPDPDSGVGAALRAAERLHHLGRHALALAGDSGETDPCCLVILQFGGGLFALDGTPPSLEQAGALSYAASLHHELPHLLVRVLDLAPTIGGDTLVDLVLAERLGRKTYAAAGYDSSLVRRIPRPVLTDPGAYKARGLHWSGEDVVLVTGGAKGITARCALALARETGVRMALVGSTPLDDAALESEIGQTLEAFGREGLTARYYACDISEQESVEALVRAIEKELGPVTGVVHGAGMNSPRRLKDVTLAQAQKEISPKIAGAIHLCNALAQKPPRLFVGLTSIIGVTGMPGNAWYAFANESLDLLLRAFRERHRLTQTLSVAYSVWEEVGMGARLGSVEVLSSMGISPIPVEEGVRRFVALCSHDAGEQQVIVTARLGALDTFAVAPGERPAADDFIRDVPLFMPGVEVVAHRLLDAGKDRFVADHDFEGSLLLPAVFGIEAMIQAAALATGTKRPEGFRLKELNFERPIVIDRESPGVMRVHAVVQESADEQMRQRVRVWISSAGSGFAVSHFSGLVELARRPEPSARASGKKEVDGPLALDPQRDLYGRLLFQGESFQRLQHFNFLSLDYLECQAAIRDYDDPSGEEVFLAGDPYFRDAILQAGQVAVGRDKALPRRIGEIVVYPRRCSAESALIIAELSERTEDHWTGHFTVADDDGTVLQEYRDCVFTILEVRREEPTCAEMADPDRRDNALLHKALGKIEKYFGVRVPFARLDNLPGLQALPSGERHRREQQVLELLLGQHCDDLQLASSGAVQLSWQTSGRPALLAPDASEPVRLSFSHDERFLLSVLGLPAQGCDIMPVLDSAGEDRHDLVGRRYSSLLAELGRAEPVNYAASRLWTAREAVFKALGRNDCELAYAGSFEKIVLFSAQVDGRCLKVATLPQFFTLGPERMLAVVVAEGEAERQAGEAERPAGACRFRPRKGTLREKALAEFGFDTATYLWDIDDSGAGAIYLLMRWPLSMRETANLSRGIYFSHYADWMGRVREMALQPIREELIAQLAQGSWGMVTNGSAIEILGEAQPNDTVQVRIWVKADPVSPDSTVTISFDWMCVKKDGSYERLAKSHLSSTFVKVTAYGEVKVQPLPGYFKDFIAQFEPLGQSGNPYEHLRERLAGVDPGSELFRKPFGPDNGPLLAEREFATTLVEANVVGNIYFSNYFSWQGAVRDGYFHDQAPQYFQKIHANQEFRCLSVEVDHLRDAMPFQKILVRMHLGALYERGCKLVFGYFQKLAGGGELKLAVGYHTAVWLDCSDRDNPQALPLPREVMAALRAACPQVEEVREADLQWG